MGFAASIPFGDMLLKSVSESMVLEVGNSMMVGLLRQFGIITAVFSLCLLLVMILANSANTLCSEKLVPLFGLVYSDVYFVDTDSGMRMMNSSAGDDIVY